jgi:CO/xanthine dehydrogenase Mo-binding subunit
MSTRRDFIRLMAAGGGALVLGVRFSRAGVYPSEEFRPNAWVRIEQDGSVVIQVGKTEMGQGVQTSLPMILAEELDVDYASVKVEQASPGPDFLRLGTGGSTSVMTSWDALRQAGAAARMMLVAAAAERWGVSPDSCITSEGVVTHPPTQRRLPYGQLVADAARQPVPEDPSLEERGEYTLVGTAVKRRNSPDIVDGSAIYGLDVRLPGMLHAVVERPPAFDGEVASFDPTAAKRVKGVREVVQISRGVAVVAESTAAAIKGREALRVQWTVGPDEPFDSVTHAAVLEAATESPGVTIRKDGEGRGAMDRAARQIESVYHYPFAAHASVEPVNCTVLVRDGSCEIWSPTQTPNAVQKVAMAVLELPETAVQVHVQLVGGGFGRRLNYDFDWEAIEIARAMKGTPVQLIWTREDDMRHGHFQAASAHRMMAGLDRGNRLVAFEHRKASTPHNIHRRPTAEQASDPDTVRGWAWGVYDSPYAFEAAEMTYTTVDAPVPIGPWRAVFSPSSVFARESFIDEIAQLCDRDPVDLRLELLGADDDAIPDSFEIGGALVERGRMRRVLQVVVRESGWGEAPPAGRARGIACNAYHTGTYVAYVVEVSRRDRISASKLPFVVHRVVCALDCGLVINPDGVRQQVESGVIWALSNMKSEITFQGGRARQSNYSDFSVAMIDETPAQLETHIVGSDASRPNGLGEPTVCPFTPAVANALSRLVGVRIRALPVRATDLRSAG